ncbi:TIGR02594 family protein [Rhodoplanes sp. SY1]|uniref:C40 family peptidase n=1 Tax=Rhodoplanes sp. SY1 TaxID=3166646 RepID=UPI0038B5DB78
MAAPWYSVAMHFRGLAEVHGATDNPKIVEMFRVAGTPEFKDDETPWCAAFVGACLRLSGFKGTGSAGARSYLQFGQDLGKKPQRGCIVVFWRGSKDAPTGHVAFFDREDGDNIVVLGGNQGDAVTSRSYPKSQWLAYRWPVETAPLPDTTLPTILTIDPDNAPPHLVTGAGMAGGPPTPFDIPRSTPASDADTMAVQARLRELGFDPGPLDGEYGPLTRAAIETFQRSRGLPVTGTADAATRRGLGLEGPMIWAGQDVGGGTAAAAPDVAAVIRAVLPAVIAALAGRTLPNGVTIPTQPTPGTTTPATPGAAGPILSPIDNLLGGEALAGKKTALAVVAYVVLAIMQSLDAVGTATGLPAPPPGTVTPPGTVAGTMTTTGQILTTLIAAFGGLGLLGKADRVVKALGIIAARAPGR